MTNEEKAKEIIRVSDASKVYDIVDFDALHKAQMEDLMEMAKWKDEQYPHWHSQDQNDILDSINDWGYHKYVCIMKDGKVCEWRGINDEHYDGSIETHICPLNEEEYSIDDILYWTELK